MKTLRDKVVVVTGAASGIGRALAVALAARGARLALVDVDEAGLSALQSELAARPAEVTIHVADVSDRERMEALPGEVVAAHGRVEVVINNAGVSVGSFFADHAIEDAEWLIGINLMGVLYGTKFFIPVLAQAEEAHIVNLSSMFGLFGMPGQAMYSASKAAVSAFTLALTSELADTSIRLTSVHPGTIQSNLIRHTRGMKPDERDAAVEVQHRFGMPAERAAEKILRAVERNKWRVLVGADAHVMVLLARIFPVGFQRLLGFAIRRATR